MYSWYRTGITSTLNNKRLVQYMHPGPSLILTSDLIVNSKRRKEQITAVNQIYFLLVSDTNWSFFFHVASIDTCFSSRDF